MRSLKGTLKLCLESFGANQDFASQAAALAYRATAHAVTGYSPYFCVTAQGAVLPPLSHEWNEPAVCLTGATWLNALWKSRLAVLRDHRAAAEANAKAAQQRGTGLLGKGYSGVAEDS